MLSVHLAVGIGYYHHLILRLQSEYNLDLLGVIDFAIIHNESISSYVSTCTRRDFVNKFIKVQLRVYLYWTR